MESDYKKTASNKYCFCKWLIQKDHHWRNTDARASNILTILLKWSQNFLDGLSTRNCWEIILIPLVVGFKCHTCTNKAMGCLLHPMQPISACMGTPLNHVYVHNLFIKEYSCGIQSFYTILTPLAAVTRASVLWFGKKFTLDKGMSDLSDSSKGSTSNSGQGKHFTTAF